MSTVIYTYSNPYKIHLEPYWASIKNCVHLCASQTLANGLCDQYTEFYKGKVSTFAKFINEIFADWESDTCSIEQRANIDNIIDSMDFPVCANNENSSEFARTSLKRNRSQVYESIRIMCELGMKPNEIQETELTNAQKCVVDIFKCINSNDNQNFRLGQKQIDESSINEALKVVIENTVSKDDMNKIKTINKDTVVIHGVHQFTPIMLRTIELLSRYKLVVLLFNYQPDYKNIYQTWLNVYEHFESKVHISQRNMHFRLKMFVNI